MENRKATEAGQGVTMQKEDFAALWKTIHLKGESFTWTQIQTGWFPLVYTGVLSSGVAYTLQIVGERDLNPAAAALIMSLESCISAISAWLILGQSLSLREIIGCVIMFAAIILVQLRRN